MAIKYGLREPNLGDKGKQRVPLLLATFGLLITLAAGTALVGTAGYFVARAGARGNDSQALYLQIAEARENLASAAPPAKTVVAIAEPAEAKPGKRLAA
jgi:hypothetical protein